MVTKSGVHPQRLTATVSAGVKRFLGRLFYRATFSSASTARASNPIERGRWQGLHVVPIANGVVELRLFQGQKRVKLCRKRRHKSYEPS